MSTLPEIGRLRTMDRIKRDRITTRLKALAMICVAQSEQVMHEARQQLQYRIGRAIRPTENRQE